MRITISNCNMFSSLICFNTALDSNYLGFIIKFHAEKIFQINFSRFSFILKKFIFSRLFFISGLSLWGMNNTIAAIINALERQRLSLRNEFDFNEIFFLINFFNNFFAILLKEIISNKDFPNLISILEIEVFYRHRQISILRSPS